jgi:mono/diheme cytochrome c family protein
LYLIALLWLAPLCTMADQHSADAADEHAVTDPALIARRMQPCTLCHAERGRATAQGYYPRIAGKPAEYLFNQLANFRAGRRHFPTMVYFAQLQGDVSLRQMANYFAAQELPYPPPERPAVGAQVLERGRRLATQGDPSAQLPSCAACHGEQLLGVEPAVPGLLGVSQDYLLGQLGAWRNDTRSADAPDCMAQIARRLSVADLSAVTAWLASQPVNGAAHPATSLPQPPPLRCGSLELAGQGASPMPAASGELARGQQLLRLGNCASCHTIPGGALLAGGRAIPTRFGTFYAPNITPDMRTGIGRWSEQDFWRALHEGLAPDGTALYPAFPYPEYTKLERRDVDAMYAYLRSLPPVAATNRAHELHFPYNVRALLSLWRALYFRAGTYRADASRGAEWNRGAYLVQALAHCSACHAPRNLLGAERAVGPTGAQILGWYAPSLLDAREAGVHDWSMPDIVALLGAGAVGTAGGPVPARTPAVTLGPMAQVVFESLQYASREDLEDIARYLQTLSALTATPVAARASDQMLYEGQSLYARHCASCHGERGQGRGPLGPPLALDRALSMSSVIDPIRVVLFGGYASGTAGNATPFGMPPFSEQLTDDQIALVLTYVRQSWGNGAAAVPASAVAPLRGSPLW